MKKKMKKNMGNATLIFFKKMTVALL